MPEIEITVHEKRATAHLHGISACQLAKCAAGIRSRHDVKQTVLRVASRHARPDITALIHRRTKPVRLILDSLPAHKTPVVRDYVQSTEGRLSLHFLAGYAPGLNPDELVWSQVKRNGTARRPLQRGEKLAGRIGRKLADVRDDPNLVRSFFDAPSIAFIRDC